MNMQSVITNLIWEQIQGTNIGMLCWNMHEQTVKLDQYNWKSLNQQAHAQYLTIIPKNYVDGIQNKH